MLKRFWQWLRTRAKAPHGLDVSSIKCVADHERAPGLMYAEAFSLPYMALHSLDEAKQFEDGYAIFQGDDGGQIYAVVPASYIQCTTDQMMRLLRDMDESEWPHNDEDARAIYFERIQPNSGVPGGMGGGHALQEPWVHPELEKKGLKESILAVLRGETPQTG